MNGPQRCYSLDDIDREIVRQKALRSRGWLRRIGGAGEHGITVEWTQGELSNGQRCWLWASGGTQFGGVWASADDADEAFKLAEFEWETLQA